MNRDRSVAARCAIAATALEALSVARLEGQVIAVSGTGVQVRGLANHLSVGDRITVRTRDDTAIVAEIVGFHGGVAHGMTFAAADGLGPGIAIAQFDGGASRLAVSDAWIGRVIDSLGRPLDSRGTLPLGSQPRPVRAPAPEATRRARLGPRLELGVRALDLFTTCRQGQRVGLFAGSGIGKSVLLSMLARNAECDVAVLALVGERGREVREFLEDDLGPDGAARSVVVVATSDSSPVMRREAAYAAMTVAEHFRDSGRNVLLLMDSVTRFCSALREIGLAAGEPPATRGYPPSVFAELPRLLERAGPGPDGPGEGRHITAFFTVLVEGDDHNEPVADGVRSILDGHVVLDRRIAEGGRYPAVDVLRSLSRTASGCTSEHERALVQRARRILAAYAEITDLVRLGAYRQGSDPASDEAIALAPRIEAMLRQDRTERARIAESFSRLEQAMQ